MSNPNGGKPGDDGNASKEPENGNADPNKDAGNNDNSDKGGSDADEKRFSQKELDEIIAKRLSRKERDDADKAKLSKEQLLEKERDEALNAVRMSDARDAFITLGTENGMQYAQASRLFKMYQADLEFDDKGKPENLKDVLKAAKADWPDLFVKKVQGDADAGKGGEGDGKPASSMNDLLRRSARKS